MGYPIYKLLRAVNRQYPNNGFINYVSVTDSVYDSDDPDEDKLIPEDLRDIINEAVQEVYKDVALDEVWSFPTVPGQNQYELPEDCDLRDIQEVTRTFRGVRGPLCPPPFPPPLPTTYTMYFDPGDGTGVMEPMEAEIGEKIILPECEFEPPEGKEFDYWIINGEPEPHYHPGDEYEMQADFIATAVWKQVGPTKVVVRNCSEDDEYITLRYSLKDSGTYTEVDIYYDETTQLMTGDNQKLGDTYDYVEAYFRGDKFSDFSMIEVFPRDTLRNLAHPTLPPEGEEPGDNDDGGYEDNPLGDLVVDPIDNGDGGNGDNPLDDQEQTPAAPGVTPEDETPIGDDNPPDNGDGGNGEAF